MSRQHLLIILILFCSSFVFAESFIKSSSSSLVNSVGIINLNELSDKNINSFDYWTCDTNAVTSIISFDSGSCYCVDNVPGLGNSSIGYGNLLECIKHDPKGSLRLLVSGSNSVVNYKINVNYKDDSLTINPTVTLVSNDNYVSGNSVVECRDDYVGSLYTKKYILYREFPFRILDSSFSGLLRVPSNLRLDDSIKCRVLYYDDSFWRDFKDSTNNLIYLVKNISISNVYFAPAYPTVEDTLYCYGVPYFDYSSNYLLDNNLSLGYNLSILDKVGNIINSSYEVNQDVNPSKKIVSYNLSGSSYIKSDFFNCNFSVFVLDNNSNIIQQISKAADIINVSNYKPKVLLNSNVRSFQIGIIEFSIYSNALKIAEIYKSGVAKIKGQVVNFDSCSNLVYTFVNDGEVISGFDSLGNFCGNVYYSQNCESGFFNVRDRNNEITMSFRDDGLCYEGFIIERWNS